MTLRSTKHAAPAPQEGELADALTQLAPEVLTQQGPAPTQQPPTAVPTTELSDAAQDQTGAGESEPPAPQTQQLANPGMVNPTPTHGTAVVSLNLADQTTTEPAPGSLSASSLKALHDGQAKDVDNPPATDRRSPVAVTQPTSNEKANTLASNDCGAPAQAVLPDGPAGATGGHPGDTPPIPTVESQKKPDFQDKIHVIQQTSAAAEAPTHTPGIRAAGSGASVTSHQVAPNAPKSALPQATEANVHALTHGCLAVFQRHNTQDIYAFATILIAHVRARDGFSPNPHSQLAQSTSHLLAKNWPVAPPAAPATKSVPHPKQGGTAKQSYSRAVQNKAQKLPLAPAKPTAPPSTQKSPTAVGAIPAPPVPKIPAPTPATESPQQGGAWLLVGPKGKTSAAVHADKPKTQNTVAPKGKVRTQGPAFADASVTRTTSAAGGRTFHVRLVDGNSTSALQILSSSIVFWENGGARFQAFDTSNVRTKFDIVSTGVIQATSTSRERYAYLLQSKNWQRPFVLDSKLIAMLRFANVTALRPPALPAKAQPPSRGTPPTALQPPAPQPESPKPQVSKAPALLPDTSPEPQKQIQASVPFSETSAKPQVLNATSLPQATSNTVEGEGEVVVNHD